MRELVDDLGDITAVLAAADRTQKSQLYDELGLELVFHPEQNLVSVGLSVPCTRSVSEGGEVLWPPLPCSGPHCRSLRERQHPLGRAPLPGSPSRVPITT